MFPMICGAGFFFISAQPLSHLISNQMFNVPVGVLEKVKTFATLFPLLDVLYNLVVSDTFSERSSPRVGLLLCLGFFDDFFILCSDRVGFIKDALQDVLVRRQLRHLRRLRGLRLLIAIFSAILCNRLMMILIFRDDSHQRDARQSKTPFIGPCSKIWKSLR